MTPSPRQQAVYDAWDNTDNNLLIEAVAGSGKTTVLLELLKKCDAGTLFLAFNKSIQTEIQTHIVSNGLSNIARAMTMHSLGFMAIREKYISAEVDNSKYYNMSNKVKDNNPGIFNRMKSGDKFKMTQMLMNMNNASRIVLSDDVDTIMEQMVAMDNYIHESPYLDELWEEFKEMRDESYEQKVVKIDFSDMIYIPVKFDLDIPVKPTYIFIDEAQDLNMSQHILVNKILSQGKTKRWVSVGDRNQAIYSFSGAHSTSFDLFKKKDNVLELPLDICYRCPADIINEANKVYDVMKGFKQEKGIVKYIKEPKEVQAASMVICRNTSPLFELYFKLVSENKQVYMKGEDILNRILNFLKPMKFDTIEQVFVKVGRKIDVLKRKKNPLTKFQVNKLEENLESVSIMVKGGFIGLTQKGGDLMDKLKLMFQETNGGIMLCTIHKAKGMESDVVYILNEFLIPSKFAKSNIQLVQEENLKYVARTRAKKELYYLNVFDEPKEPQKKKGKKKKTSKA